MQLALLVAFALAVVACLLAMGLERKLQSSGQDPCRCLNWKRFYKASRLGCGRGLEYYLVTKRGMPWPEAAKRVGDEFCGKFFQRIDDSFCVNADFTNSPRNWTGRQWCYVSAECKALDGGKVIPNGDVSWKLCSHGDDMLRLMTPEQLDKLRGRLDLDLGLLAKFAYPVWQGAKWPDVASFFMGAGAVGRRTSENRTELEWLVQSGRLTLFDSRDNHPPFHIVMGSSVYKINFTAYGRQSYAAGRMGDVNNLSCVQGCGSTSAFA